MAQNINYEHKSIKKELTKTWGIPENNIELKELKGIKNILGKFFILPEAKFIYVGRVNSCRAGGCSTERSNNGESEFFDYFILFDKNANVKAVKVFNYAATHGYEVSSKGWLKQFVGYTTGQNLDVGKDVDTISGATISVYAITHDIKEKTNLLYEYLKVQN